MPNRQLVYIAGPYRASDRSEEARNVLKASALSRLAIRKGLSPIVVHPGIYLGAYGDDSDHRDRAAGLKVATRIVEAVAMSGGAIWVLLDENGGLSEGTGAELRTYRKNSEAEASVKTWDEWVAEGARLSAGLI